MYETASSLELKVISGLDRREGTPLRLSLLKINEVSLRVRINGGINEGVIEGAYYRGRLKGQHCSK